MKTADVYRIAADIDSPTFRQALGEFKQRRGAIVYEQTGSGSKYEFGKTIQAGGTIFVDASHVAGLAHKHGDFLLALQAVLIHEMGHFMYAMQSRMQWPGPSAAIDARAEHCLRAEARATTFAYRVAKELRAKGQKAVVLAPGDQINMFENMARAEAARKNLVDLAQREYAADTTYKAYCRGEIPWTGYAVQQLPPIRIVGKRQPK